MQVELGWTPRPKARTSRSARQSPWFAVNLNRRNAPWAFARGEAFRAIASLELLGYLVSVMVLLPAEEFQTASVGMATLTRGTDNQGNHFLLDKLMTTKYPLGVVLMELSCQLGLRRASLQARWIPRLQNEEADALTNGDYRHFDEALRVPVKLEELQFRVLNDLFREGDEYIQELEALKAADKDARKGQRDSHHDSIKTPKHKRALEKWG